MSGAAGGEEQDLHERKIKTNRTCWGDSANFLRFPFEAWDSSATTCKPSTLRSGRTRKEMAHHGTLRSGQGKQDEPYQLASRSYVGSLVLCSSCGNPKMGDPPAGKRWKQREYLEKYGRCKCRQMFSFSDVPFLVATK